MPRGARFVVLSVNYRRSPAAATRFSIRPRAAAKAIDDLLAARYLQGVPTGPGASASGAAATAGAGGAVLARNSKRLRRAPTSAAPPVWCCRSSAGSTASTAKRESGRHGSDLTSPMLTRGVDDRSARYREAISLGASCAQGVPVELAIVPRSRIPAVQAGGWRQTPSPLPKRAHHENQVNREQSCHRRSSPDGDRRQRPSTRYSGARLLAASSAAS